MHTVAEIADALIKYRRAHEDQFFWASQLLDDACKNDLDLAFEIILALLERVDSEWEFSNIGAGPLEDLVKKQGIQALSKIEDEYSTNPKLKAACNSIWLNSSHPAFNRLRELVDPNVGFSEGFFPNA